MADDYANPAEEMLYDSATGMRLDLRQLRYFLAIAETGSLSHAARKLNVAQSAVSHHLSELEARLGVSLVERHARGVTLTQAGQRLREHARSILSAVSRAEGDVRSLSEASAGPVSLGLSHTVTRRIAVPLMRRIKSDHPGILLGLAEALSMPLLDKLLAGEVHVATMYNPPDDPRIDVRHILDEDIYIIGQADYLKTTGDIPFDEVIDLPLVMPYPSATTKSLVENFFLRNRLPERIMEFDSLFAINQALIEGIGCSILARSTAAEALLHPGMIARRIVDPTVSRSLCLVRLRDRHRSRAEADIEKLVMELIATEVNDGRWLATLAAP